jgi:ribosomal protein S18 acetylase RimI-like enzyme
VEHHRRVPDDDVRLATSQDAEQIGGLLHDFNAEFAQPTPAPDWLAARVRLLFEAGDTLVLVVGAPPDGLAVLRFRHSIWSAGLECYLAELYVVPERRGQGIGRSLMESAVEAARQRGADYMYLGTNDDDVVARHLYERLGFTNREGGPEGPVMYVYEREL